MRGRAVVAAAVALLSAPVLTGSSLTGTASAAERAETAGTTVAAAAAEAPVYARLYNQGTGKCLAVPSANPANGVVLIQWTCSTSASQYWTLEPVTNGYRVRNQATGKCLAIGSSSTDGGAKAIQWPCSDNTDQVWAHDETDRLRNANSSLCLAIPNSTTTNGTEAMQWTCSGRDQQWLW
ncbi:MULTISPECIES: RICIN domain-containing protein [Streptomyces]|uniref:RICIN domain-containing protein n=1 Tax=Streptomyces TaxID=1883 RepID=UPI001F2ECA24|nr:RICIN domain-containing protein [Streptomyces liliifuscus]